MAQIILDILKLAEQEDLSKAVGQYSCILNNKISEISSLYLNELPPQASYALLHDHEKCFLHLLAKSLPNDGMYIEVGSWLCGSACIVANSNTTMTVRCHDPFYDIQPTRFQQEYYNRIIGPGLTRTISAIRKIIDPFPYIQLYPTFSPAGLTQYEIDVYFEDGDHTDPGLAKNLNFWLPCVKEGGYALIHDYRPWARGSNIIDKDGTNIYWDDVYNHVERLRQDEEWQYLGFVYSLAVFKRRKKRP